MLAAIFTSVAMLVCGVMFPLAMRWPVVQIIKGLVSLLNEKEQADLCKRLKPGDVNAAKAGRDCDQESSSWSVIEGDLPPESAQELCRHQRTTTKGSNQYEKRVSCKDCGILLETKKAECKENQFRILTAEESRQFMTLMMKVKAHRGTKVYDPDRGLIYDPEVNGISNVWDAETRTCRSFPRRR